MKRRPAKKASKKKQSKEFHISSFFIISIIIIVLVFLYHPVFLSNAPELVKPQRFESEEGVLETSLTAKKDDVTIAGKTVNARVYNGSYQTPLFVIKGGDRFKVDLTNELDEPTNLHFHGSHVSPKGHSDNVLVSVEKGETFAYEYHLPSDHPPGLYWYHPHVHPFVENQVADGMAGPIIVKGDIDELPGIKGVPEKVLVLQSRDSDDSGKPIRLVNGMKHPKITIRPNEVMRLRILNASADAFFNLQIDGYKLNIISRDGNTLGSVQTVESEVLSPGDRIEILIKGKMPGNYAVRTLAFEAEPEIVYQEDTFMTLQVAGIPSFGSEIPTTLIPFEDLRNVPVDNTRTLTFGFEKGPNNEPLFTLDGQIFNPDVISQIMTLNTVEQWNLVNETDMWHPFHIHINPFQVISVNGEEIDRNGYDDTYGIPPNSTVVIKTEYKDFDGKYVLHCHVLFHEDHGMMQVVEVVKPGEESAPHNGAPEMEKMLHHSRLGH